ncbi:CBS domain-containing protein [Acidianus sp.]|uniref:CBS domain-containing protein n=1 Tax=Acidianus sp. TaxID=1872104 RepID=UPI003978A33C
MLVKDVMSPDVIKVTKDTKIYDALNIMIRNNIRRLVVESNGIVTIRDIVYNWGKIDDTVDKIMTSDLQFIDKNSDLKEACRIVTAKGIGSLVVGNGDNIEGIITERDLIRYCKADINSFVQDIMNKNPLIISANTTLAEVVEFMKQKYVRHAIVACANLPCGVISTKDIGKALLAKKDLTKTEVSGFMSNNVFKVYPDDKIETARMLMAEKNIGFLPVTNSKEILGSLSEREILAVLSI